MTNASHKTDPATYNFLFGILKTLENSKINYSFTAHGKDQAINFKLVRHQQNSVGSIVFRPVKSGAMYDGSKAVCVDYITAVGKEIAEKRVDVSHESEKALATILGGLMGRAQMARLNVERQKVWNGTGVRVRMAGTLTDEDNAVLGYLDFDFVLSPARRF